MSANAFDERTSGSSCPPDGCVAANTRDGSLSTRWSCKKDLNDGRNCEITFDFQEPQDIELIRVAFFKGDERTREVKVEVNGSQRAVIESSGETLDFEDFELTADEATTVSLESLGLSGSEWISLTEVSYKPLEAVEYPSRHHVILKKTRLRVFLFNSFLW